MKITVVFLALCAFSARAEGGYTNHAGNVVAGCPVKLTATHVTLAERAATDSRLTTNDYPLATNGYNLSTFQLFNNKLLPSLDLSRIRAAANRGGLRTAARAGGREAGDRRGGEGDGAFAQAGGEGALHKGGKRCLLREVRSRAQEVSRQTG